MSSSPPYIADVLREFPQVQLIAQNDQVSFLQTQIRDKETNRIDFVYYADRLIRLIFEHGLTLLPHEECEVMTPTGVPYKGHRPSSGICGVSIMRAGESMEQALRDTCRGARVGKILIQRNEKTAEPDTRYNYSKMPPDVKDRWVFLMDPMLATGGSAIRACQTLIEQYGVAEERIIFLNVVSCPEGIAAFTQAYPKIRIVTSAIDERLNEHKYILPGLGDFGDRYFGTN